MDTQETEVSRKEMHRSFKRVIKSDCLIVFIDTPKYFFTGKITRGSLNSQQNEVFSYKIIKMFYLQYTRSA